MVTLLTLTRNAIVVSNKVDCVFSRPIQHDMNVNNFLYEGFRLDRGGSLMFSIRRVRFGGGSIFFQGRVTILNGRSAIYFELRVLVNFDNRQGVVFFATRRALKFMDGGVIVVLPTSTSSEKDTGVPLLSPITKVEDRVLQGIVLPSRGFAFSLRVGGLQVYRVGECCIRSAKGGRSLR